MSKCGCIIGKFLCPEAVRLWKKRGVAGDKVSACIREHPIDREACDDTWAEYEECLRLYKKHIAQVKEVA